MKRHLCQAIVVLTLSGIPLSSSNAACDPSALPSCRETIPGLHDALSPIVTPGKIHYIQSPSSVRHSESGPLSAEEFADIIGPRRTPQNKMFAEISRNWLTTRHPDASLERIAAMTKERYRRLILSRVPPAWVTTIEVQPMTLVYPRGYTDDQNEVTVHARRLTIHTSDELTRDRPIVAYYANYDLVDPENAQVIFQINGHFGNNPSRRALGLEGNGGLTGGFLGRLAAKGLPLITYDDHDVGESYHSRGITNGLYRTLFNLRVVDALLLTNFDQVDAMGLSGGAERLYHYLLLHRAPVKSAYIAGFFQPPWTALDSQEITGGPFSYDRDTFDETFSKNFRWSSMVLAGIAEGVNVAFVSNTLETGIGKYFLQHGMIPTILRYTTNFEVHGDDRNFDGKPDFFSTPLAHEIDLRDYLSFLRENRTDMQLVNGAGTAPRTSY